MRDKKKKAPEETTEQKKEPKRKPRYSTATCIKWLFTRMWQWDKSIVWASLLVIPISVILYALGLYIPSVVLDKLEGSDSFNEVAMTILAVLGAQLIFQMIKDWLGSYRGMNAHRGAMRFYYELVKKGCGQDFFLWYDEENNTLRERAFAVLGNGANKSPVDALIAFSDVASNVLCFLLFGSVISLLSPWIIVLLIAGSLIQAVVRIWKQVMDHLERDERAVNDKKIKYLSWRLSNQPKAGKDIRLYNLAPFLEEKGNVLIEEHTELLRHRQKTLSVQQFTGFAITALRDGLAYLFLLQGVVRGEIGSAEFVLYFSAISAMSGFIQQIINYFSDLYETGLKISDCIEYLEENRDKLNHGQGIPLPKGRPLSIEFRNVTYKYPKGDKNVLENVSFKIEPGEKISLVGLNGAGKTTLTKLMCGLIVPDAGEVLIDGHSTLEYNCDELYTLFSMVPQDYTTLPTTIAENITFCERENIDEARLWRCLEQADMAESIRALPKGIDTSMEKQFDVDAVEFSGGEMQKILLARALYRSAPILILDEPTAALDPIAEDRMYHKYSEIAKDTTSIFISHRLASTQFCDRIYLLDGARFTEEGTHEELMALGGKYRELFDVQSKYYKEGGEEGEE